MFETIELFMKNGFIHFRLIASVNRNFGTPGVSTIRSLDKDKYPVIIVINRIRSSTEISNVLSGMLDKY